MLKTAVFFDVQGTLGGKGTDNIGNFTFYPFSIEGIKLVNDNNMLAIAVTNQSHIGKGLLSIEEYNSKIVKLQNELFESGARLDYIYCCPHTKEDNCTCKKPLPGLLEQAKRNFDLDLTKSYVIGDMGMSDIVMAKKVGATAILVLTGVGKGSLNEYRDTWKQVEADYIAENVLEAVKWIISVNAFA